MFILLIFATFLHIIDRNCEDRYPHISVLIVELDKINSGALRMTQISFWVLMA